MAPKAHQSAPMHHVGGPIFLRLIGKSSSDDVPISANLALSATMILEIAINSGKFSGQPLSGS